MAKSKKKNSDEKASLFGMFKHPLEINEIVEEILERNVVKIGNGAHINIPLKHLGKKARVIIKRGDSDGE